MESTHHVTVPLRAGKKMKKRKELDALVAHSGPGKRLGGGGGGGSSPQDQLLSESTDEHDDYWSGKDRGSGGSSGGGGGPRCRMFYRRRLFGSLLRACTAFLVFACVVATTTVMWLFIDIREQVTSLRNELDQVAAGSQGVPEELQKCHSLSRELQQNQTLLARNISAVSLQLESFSAQLSVIQAGLRDVDDRLKAAPQLVNLPQDVQSLSTSVASFGSQIRDLNTTVTMLKNENSQLQESSKTLSENVTILKQRVMQIANTTLQSQIPSTEDHAEKEEMKAVLQQLSANMTLVNDTLNKKLQWLGEDESKNKKSVFDLQDLGQNVSARLTTLEGSCVKSALHSALNMTVEKLSHQMATGEDQLNELAVKVSQLRAQTDELERNGTLLSSQVGHIMSRQGPDMQEYTEAFSHPQPQPGTEASGDGPTTHNSSR